jgi:hypothetical protein
MQSRLRKKRRKEYSLRLLYLFFVSLRAGYLRKIYAERYPIACSRYYCLKSTHKHAIYSNFTVFSAIFFLCPESFALNRRVLASTEFMKKNIAYTISWFISKRTGIILLLSSLFLLTGLSGAIAQPCSTTTGLSSINMSSSGSSGPNVINNNITQGPTSCTLAAGSVVHWNVNQTGAFSVSCPACLTITLQQSTSPGGPWTTTSTLTYAQLLNGGAGVNQTVGAGGATYFRINVVYNIPAGSPPWSIELHITAGLTYTCIPKAPALSATTATNTCPAATVNLNSLISSSSCPAGSSTQWFTSSTPSIATKVATPTAVATSGTYYSACYDPVKGCFGTVSPAVTVTIINCALPIDVSSFTAIASDCERVKLAWEVSNAVQFNHFEIERNTGNGYTKIAAIPYSSADSKYSYTDENLTARTYQYRLRLVDIDNSSRYTDTKMSGSPAKKRCILFFQIRFEMM